MEDRAREAKSRKQNNDTASQRLIHHKGRLINLQLGLIKLLLHSSWRLRGAHVHGYEHFETLKWRIECGGKNFGPKILILLGRSKSFGTHVTEKPPRHLVRIVFWSGMGRNGPKMPMFGPK